MSIAVDPQHPATLCATTCDLPTGGGAFKSTNGGASWIAAYFGQPTTNAISPTLLNCVNTITVDPLNTANLYVGLNGSGVFKSTDGSATWRSANVGLEETKVTAIVVDPANPSTLYAFTYNVGADSSYTTQVFRSTDGAAPWGPFTITVGP